MTSLDTDLRNSAELRGSLRRLAAIIPVAVSASTNTKVVIIAAFMGANMARMASARVM